MNSPYEVWLKAILKKLGTRPSFSQNEISKPSGFFVPHNKGQTVFSSDNIFSHFLAILEHFFTFYQAFFLSC